MKTLGIGALVIGALPALASAEVFTKDWQQATLDKAGACQTVDLGDGREGVACPAMVIYVDQPQTHQVQQRTAQGRQALALTQNTQGQLSWYALDSSTETVVSQMPWSRSGQQSSPQASEATLPTGGMVW